MPRPVILHITLLITLVWEFSQIRFVRGIKLDNRLLGWMQINITKPIPRQAHPRPSPSRASPTRLSPSHAKPARGRAHPKPKPFEDKLFPSPCPPQAKPLQSPTPIPSQAQPGPSPWPAHAEPSPPQPKPSPPMPSKPFSCLGTQLWTHASSCYPKRGGVSPLHPCVCFT